MCKRRFLAIGVALGLFAAGLGRAATNAAPIDEQKIEMILKSVSPSVVKVEARNGIRKVATGVVIDKDGTIVTTALISPRDEKITVLTFEGKEFKADFKGFDISTGLAVIQVRDTGLPAIAMGKAVDARPGTWTGAIGFSPENTPAITQGIISSVTDERIRLNLWVMPGASGCPVVNSDGRMTGVLRGTYVEEQPVVFEFRDQQFAGSGTILSRAEAPSSGMALAVPVELVLSIAGDIKKNGKVLRGWAGFTVLEAEGRLEVEGIEPKSPAESAKLKVGDIILRIDGRDLSSGAVFSREIRKRKPGTEVTLGIKRDGADKDIKVKLGEYTEEEGRRELESRFPGLFPSLEGQETVLPRSKVPGEPFIMYGNRKYIGARLQPLAKDLAEYFGAKDGKGLLVGEFEPDSPAQKAGLKVGDVLIKADGKSLEDITDLTNIIESKKKGEKIKLEILRDRKLLSLEIPVMEDISAPSGQNAAYRTLQEYQNALGDRPGFSDVREKLVKMTREMSQSGARSPIRIVTKKGVFYQV